MSQKAASRLPQSIQPWELHLKMAKPTIIGLYGISGSGKSYLLNRLKTATALPAQGFAFYDGSEVLARVTPGGLDAFKLLDAAAKQTHIEAALAFITQTCLDRGETAVVAGHYMFWNPGVVVAIDKDWQTYTHIMYLDTVPGVVAQQIAADATRHGAVVNEEELRAWQDREREELRRVCRDKGILFTTLRRDPDAAYLAHVATLLLDFQGHTEASNLARVERALGLALPESNTLEKVLLFDADKTLAPHDTGAMFWDLAESCLGDSLTSLFTEQGYSYQSFRQAVLLYEDEASRFDALCDRVAAAVTMDPDMKALMARAATEPHIGVVVVTCGLRRVWEKVLARHELPHVQIIGGGRVADGYVVTGEVKGQVVDMLHAQSIRVAAFGDGPLDMEMLQRAAASWTRRSEQQCSTGTPLPKFCSPPRPRRVLTSRV
jgi:phosphoserine phosphatase